MTILRSLMAIFVATALLEGACSSDKKNVADAGGGAGGRGDAEAADGSGGAAGTTGGAGGVVGGIGGQAGQGGAGGIAGRGGSGGDSGGGSGNAGQGGAGGSTCGNLGQPCCPRAGGGTCQTGFCVTLVGSPICAAPSGGNGGGAGRGGAAGGAGGVAGAGGATCTPTSCGASQYCEQTFKTCGGGPGSCRARPLDCTGPEQKVCACDGQLYRSACDANAAGQDLSEAGGCIPPSGTFACGPLFCVHGAEFCLRTIGGAPMFVPGHYQCLALPAACGATPACDCLAGASSCPMCAVSTGGDLTSTCLVL
jgi:hypothetical protein